MPFSFVCPKTTFIFWSTHFVLQPLGEKDHWPAVKVPLLPLSEDLSERVDEVLLLPGALDRRLELEEVLVDAAAFVDLQPKKIGQQLDPGIPTAAMLINLFLRWGKNHGDKKCQEIPWGQDLVKILVEDPICRQHSRTDFLRVSCMKWKTSRLNLVGALSM